MKGVILLLAIGGCGVGRALQPNQRMAWAATTRAARSNTYPFGPIENTAAAVGDNCTGATKQKALYLEYTYAPDLESTPALDVTVQTDWVNITGIRKYGANGVFASHPFSTTKSIGGYFGSQVTGNISDGGLLFSAWDYEVKPLNPACQGAFPNATWCNHRHAWPVSDGCDRHCLDCGLHPGWHNTTGTQCGLKLQINEGDAYVFHFWQSKANTTYKPPLAIATEYVRSSRSSSSSSRSDDGGDGGGGGGGGRNSMPIAPEDVVLYGSEWTLTALLVGGARADDAVEAIAVGVMFYEDTYLGLGRLSAFHEHIGCTDCNAFFESEKRSGPWINATSRTPQRSAYVNFTAPDPICKLFDVTVPDTHDSALISTGPGTYTPG